MFSYTIGFTIMFKDWSMFTCYVWPILSISIRPKDEDLIRQRILVHRVWFSAAWLIFKFDLGLWDYE